MPLWTNTDNANGEPKFVYALTRNGPQGSGNANEAANAAALYNNVSPGAFGANDVVGCFAVTGQDFANTSAPEWSYPAHLGWHMRIAGEGALTTITVGGTSTGYNNTDTIRISGGSTNSSATLTTNSTGGITNTSITTTGLFPNTSALTFTVLAANGAASNGTGATFTGTLGGRAGRVQYECIVAMGSITGTANTIPG